MQSWQCPSQAQEESWHKVVAILDLDQNLLEGIRHLMEHFSAVYDART